MMKFTTIALPLFLMSAPAMALTEPAANETETTTSTTTTAPTQSATEEAKPVKDPNRMICRREKEMGTRLGSRKTCMTAQEWETQRQTQAAEVDKIQKARPLNGE